ncbi:MAG: hypothetical protein ACOCRV_02015, partial [bacterium]
SLAGLEELFNDSELVKKEGSISLKTAYLENEDSDYDFTLAGFYQNQLKWRTDFTINELLTDRHLIAITGHLYDNIWMGIELIVLEEDEVEVALILRDKVLVGSFEIIAGINPLSYNFENDGDNINWYLKAKTLLGQNLNLALEYKSLSEFDYGEVDLSYDFNNYSLLMGYSWNLEIEDERAYWLGIKFNF